MATGCMPPDIVYYDAMNTQVVSHFSHSTNLSEPSFVGMSQVWETGKAGLSAAIWPTSRLNGSRCWAVRR